MATAPFPTAPTLHQVHPPENPKWIFDGQAWTKLGSLRTGVWSGPFEGATEEEAIAVANATIPQGGRQKGMQVNLVIDGVTELYWYKDGVDDLDLTKVSSAPRAIGIEALPPAVLENIDPLVDSSLVTIGGITCRMRLKDLVSYSTFDANNNIFLGPGTLPVVTEGFNNIAIGIHALNKAVTAWGHIAIGHEALATIAGGGDSIAIGRSALRVSYTDTNVALGNYALSKNTHGNYNLAVGNWALINNVTGSNNIAIGIGALQGCLTGTMNLAIGHNAARSVTDGAGVTAVGNEALRDYTGEYATAIGVQALVSCTTGESNTAIGANALSSNTTGDFNIALGEWAMQDNISGNSNVGIGASALQRNTTGERNLAIGPGSLGKNLTGSYNIAFGWQALAERTAGLGNLAIGTEVLRDLVSGNFNVAIGNGILQWATTADSTTGIGAYALLNNIGTENLAIGAFALRGADVTYESKDLNPNNGSRNTAIGTYALNLNTSGNDNTAIGLAVLGKNTSGKENVGIGGGCLINSILGVKNTGIGFNALLNLAPTANTGENTAIGHRAGESLNTAVQTTSVGSSALASHGGSNNTALGYKALHGSTGWAWPSNPNTGTHNIAIGCLTGADMSAGSYNVLIGDSSAPSSPDGNNQIVIGYNLTGKGDNTAFIGGTAGAFNGKNVSTWEVVSDARLKRDITPTRFGLTTLCELKIRDFRHTKESGLDHLHFRQGVVAQEVLEVFPEAVQVTSEGWLSVNPDPIFWTTVRSVQELKSEIDALRAEVELLKRRAL